jgi:hypothetical protein
MGPFVYSEKKPAKKILLTTWCLIELLNASDGEGTRGRCLEVDVVSHAVHVVAVGAWGRHAHVVVSFGTLENITSSGSGLQYKTF